MISVQQFGEIEIRVGEVVDAINKEGSDKLIKLLVNFGEFQRTIFTGVRTYGYEPEDFAGKKFLFVTNLEYKKMLDEESQGMILAVGEDKPLFIEVPNLPVGEKVR